LKRFLRVLLWCFGGVVLLLILLTILINSHWGINAIKNIVLTKVNKIPNVAVGLSDIDVNIFGRISIKDVTLRTKYQDISSENITVRFTPLSLMKKEIRSITIITPIIRIKGRAEKKAKIKKDHISLPGITARKIYIKGGFFEFQDYKLNFSELSGSIIKKKDRLSLNITNLQMKYKSIPVRIILSAEIDTALNIHINPLDFSISESRIIASGALSQEKMGLTIDGKLKVQDFSFLLKKKIEGDINLHCIASGQMKNPDVKGSIKISDFFYNDLKINELYAEIDIKDRGINLRIERFDGNAMQGEIYADFDRNLRGTLILNGFDVSYLKKGIVSNLNGQIKFSLKEKTKGNFNILLSHSSFQNTDISHACIKIGMKNNIFKIDTLLLEGKGLGINIEGDVSKEVANLTISADSIKLESFSNMLNLPIEGRIHSDIAVIGNIKNPTIVGNLWGTDINFKNIGIPYFEMGISANNIMKFPEGIINANMKNISIGKTKLNNFSIKIKGSESVLNYRIQGNYEGKALLLAGISHLKNGLKIRMDTFRVADSIKGDIINPKSAFINILKGEIQIDKFILNGPGSNINIWGSYSKKKLDLVMDITASDLRRVAGYMSIKKIIKGNGEFIFNISGSQNRPVIGILGWMNDFVFEDARYDSIRVQMGYKQNIFSIDKLKMYRENKISKIEGVVPVLLDLSSKKRVILSQEPMNVKINIEDLGLWPFARFKSIMDIYRGKISLNTLIRGTVKNPVIKGKVGIDSIGIYLTALGTKITGIQGNVKFDNKKVVIGPLNGKTGTGKFFTSGSIKMEAFKPQTMDIKTNISRLSIKGIKDVDAFLGIDIAVKGSVKSPEVTGNVKINKAVISIPFKKKEGGSVASAKSPVKMHLKIIMPGNVWLRNQFADMELSGNITVERHKTIKIDGKAEVVDGYFYYFDKPFKVEKGEFRFQGGGELNPGIDLIARTEVRMQKKDESGNIEEITGPVVLVVGGTMLSPTFDLHTESPLPPLELKDIIPLLNVDMTWEQIASFQKMSSALPSKAITYFIRTQLLNRIQSTMGIDALDLQANLFGETKSTKITVGKYITKNIYTSYSKDILAQSPDQFKVQYFIKKYGSFTAERDEQGRYWSGIEFRLKF